MLLMIDDMHAGIETSSSTRFRKFVHLINGSSCIHGRACMRRARVSKQTLRTISSHAAVPLARCATSASDRCDYATGACREGPSSTPASSSSQFGCGRFSFLCLSPTTVLRRRTPSPSMRCPRPLSLSPQHTHTLPSRVSPLTGETDIGRHFLAVSTKNATIVSSVCVWMADDDG